MHLQMHFLSNSIIQTEDYIESKAWDDPGLRTEMVDKNLFDSG
jgi:hypothetical protein